MKLKITILAAYFILSLGFASCSSNEADRARRPAFLQKDDSMSKKPAMGDTAGPNQTGN